MGIPLRVLIVEDNEDDAALLILELRRGGYEVIHERVETSAGLTRALDTKTWDIVVSDHSMPHFSGIDALKQLRTRGSEVPFVFCSGTIGEEAAVAALRNGAQDYVMKTNMRRLVSVVQRELREVKDRQERKELEHEVQQLHKFEAIGRLAGGIAHDFNNVIGAILGWAELCQDDAPPGTPLRDRLQKITDQIKRASGLTSQLLSFARRQILQPRRLDLNAQVLQGMSLLRRVIGEHITVSIQTAPDLHVTLADPAQADQVLMNLCLNARDAMPNGGQLTIETRNMEINEKFCKLHRYARPGDYVLLAVSDTGTGMDAETVEQIFEPFFTTKEMGKGTGLGLATVYGIVKQHGGFIEVDSVVGEGTAFRVYLPTSAGAPETLEKPVEEMPVKGTETILLAEDHDGLRQSVREMLETLGYSVILAADGLEAVQHFEANRERIHLVVLDVVMPNLSGPEAFLKMTALRPDLQAIFTTGYTTEAKDLTSMVKAGASLLQKPFSQHTIGQMVRGLLDPAPAVPSH